MNTTVAATPMTGRTLILFYGVFSYFAGVAGLLCIIAACAGLVPFGFLGALPGDNPLIINIVLVALWGGIHSVMARSGFKRLLTRYIAEPAERPTYVLIAGITSILLIGWWQPLTGVAWSFTNPIIIVLLWTVFAFGWAYLFGATFAINHFDLFGLRQVYLHYKNLPRPPVHFMKRAMYRFTRHPIQTGVVIGIWATPQMTMTHLALSVGLTAYIFIGLWFEEKDLVKMFGDRYIAYRKEAGLLLPKFKSN